MLQVPRGTGVAWLFDRAVEKPQEEEAALTGAGVRAAPGGQRWIFSGGQEWPLPLPPSSPPSLAPASE